MKIKTMNLKTAVTLDQRIKELQRLIEEKSPDLSQRKSELTHAENKVNAIQDLINRENAPPLRGEVRNNRMFKEEKERTEAELVELQGLREAAEKNLLPLQNEMNKMNAELNELMNNPPKAEIQDLIIAKRELDTLDGQIQQIEAAAERAAGNPIEDQIADLKANIDLLSAERDMAAADADLGKATPADVKKISTEMNRLKKKLEDLEETGNLSESTQRGYQRHLNTLRAQYAEAEHGYRVMFTLYARGIYKEGLERLQNAADTMKIAIADMTTASNLANAKGAGETLSGSRIRLVVDAEGVHEFERLRIEADDEEVAGRIEKLLQGIQEQTA